MTSVVVMPTVALYVPARLWRLLGEDAGRVREIAIGALELGAGDVPGVAVTGDAATDGEARGGVIPPRPGVRISPSSAPSLKRCSREARHHLNHSGKPCPECGFPVT